MLRSKILFLSFFFICSICSAQKSYTSYPLVRLDLKDGSSLCGYFDSSHYILYDCGGTQIFNAYLDIKRKYPDDSCCLRAKKSNDVDGDGINNNEDTCPNQQGPASNLGCPFIVNGCFYPRINYFPKPILFRKNEFRLLGTSISNLKQLVRALQDQPVYRIIVEGYISKPGNYLVNVKLAKARANIVAKFLVDAGIDESRVTTEIIWYKRNLSPDGKSEVNEWNGRVEFRYENAN
jgi:outer membrane protein OmpA-like peptidoglycan-associated protein